MTTTTKAPKLRPMGWGEWAVFGLFLWHIERPITAAVEVRWGDPVADLCGALLILAWAVAWYRWSEPVVLWLMGHAPARPDEGGAASKAAGGGA